MINGDKEIKESTETSEEAEGERIPIEDGDSPELIAIKKEIILSDKTFEESTSYRYVKAESDRGPITYDSIALIFRGNRAYEEIGPIAGTFIIKTENSGIWTGVQGLPDSRFYFTKNGLLKLDSDGTFMYFKRLDN